ncbi:type IV secretion system DNA-binding domain-containing protein [Candidatus Peregrinibacteria bacterium]|nr:type IV secretion system DNA-binding domain-containing protein [Candidatus Peregrinibacteria bacterium]MBI3816083.1 type IV secretion system DNA-binding domain-containing protein [Candidatus Peregrinibacteria bacterium]
MALRYIHIIVPQGTEGNQKLESKFQELLINMRNTFTGKRVALEFHGYAQYTYLYIVVDESLLETVEGLIYSTFPEAELKETKDYTLAYDSKKQAIAGATVTLHHSDVYPIKTYDIFEEDSASRLFAVNSKIGLNDQTWAQIIAEPEDDTGWFHFKRKWRRRIADLRHFFSIRDRLREGGRKAIAELRHARAREKAGIKPYRVSIRCAYIAEDQASANRRLEAVVSSFSQFNDRDVNEFHGGHHATGSRFVDRFRSREHAIPFVLSAKEVATLFHFPNADYVPHIVHVLARKSDPPQDLPNIGERDVSGFGITNYHNNFVPFGIRRSDRRRHLYSVGKSGSGKSKLLELLIQEDIKNGEGVAVLDPHGDLVDAVLRFIPEHRIHDVVLLNPADTEFPIAFNPLEKIDEAYKMQLTIGFLQIFKKLFGDNWTYRLEHVLRYTTLALLDSPNTTVLSILKMLSDKNYRQKIVSRIQDSVVKSFWVSEFAAWSEKFDAEAITPLLNKVGQFVATNMIRNIIGQPKTKFDIRTIMDEKKILLLKISKGLLGEENSSLMGSMIITKLYQAAMSRADTPEDERTDFYFYVDEFQNFATDTFTEILSEARKYRLNLTIAHQYMGQLSDLVRKTVFGNVGSMITFRVGAEDASVLAAEYNPIFKERDIINLGVREFYTKMSVNGELREAFSGRTLDAPHLKENYTPQIIASSRAKYCTPRKDVETMLAKWDEAASAPPKKEEIDASETFEEPLI